MAFEDATTDFDSKLILPSTYKSYGNLNSLANFT